MLLMYLFQLLIKSPVLFLLAFILLIIPLLLSITIHEWSHGMVAYKFGDPTPKIQGRLSFNPFAHLDPLGTILLLTIGFGWAKPVMINPRNIPGKTKMMLVSLAGPASNFMLAIIFSIIAYFLNHDILSGIITSKEMLAFISQLISIIIRINTVLGTFNLMPIPPLDGSNIVKWILPGFLADMYESLAPYGIIILIILMWTVGFGSIFHISQEIAGYIYKGVEMVLDPVFKAIIR